MLSWEGTQILGASAISEKLVVSPRWLLGTNITDLTPSQGLPFEKVQHKVTTLDAQPSSPTVSSLIVSVTGMLLVRVFFVSDRDVSSYFLSPGR